MTTPPTISREEVWALATAVLCHRLTQWGTAGAPKGRVRMIPEPPVPCELAWAKVSAALRAGTLEVS